MLDVRDTIKLSEKRLEKLHKWLTAVEQCLDIHYVFIPGFQQWINTNLREIRSEARTIPKDGILAAMEMLWLWERPLDMLHARIGRQYESEQSAKEKAQATTSVADNVETTAQRTHHTYAGISQPSAPGQLQVQLLEDLNSSDEKSLEDLQSDTKSLEDFREFLTCFLEVDAGRSFPLIWKQPQSCHLLRLH